MRKDKKELQLTVDNRFTGYHNRENFCDNYAFSGFTTNELFTSDRNKKLVLSEDGTFKRADGLALKGYGLEREMESTMLKSQSDLVRTIKEYCFNSSRFDNLYKYQTDGSLSSVSIEQITQIMTKEFIRNSYPDTKIAYSRMEMFNISAYTSGNCGMHINCSIGLFGKTKETQDEAIKKLYFFMNTYYDFACKIWYRRSDRTTFCSSMYCPDMDYAKSINLANYGSSHGVCLNLGHYNEGRIEIRLVGGQKDFASYRNTMEITFHIVETLKDLSWNDMKDFKKIFKGCNQFVCQRLKDAIGLNGFSQEDYDYIYNNRKVVDFGCANTQNF